MDVQKYLRRKGVSKLTNDNLQVGVYYCSSELDTYSLLYNVET